MQAVTEAAVPKKNPNLTMKQKINAALMHPVMVILMTLVTIYTLFFDDLRIVCFPISSDNFWYSCSAIALLVFVVEMCLSIYALDEYFCTFFFWLDLISTITMIPDIGWLWNLIVGGETGSNQATDIAKASRASKVTRLLRVVRLVRIIRLVKLYK